MDALLNTYGSASESSGDEGDDGWWWWWWLSESVEFGSDLTW